MRYVIYTDPSGYRHRSAIRDNDSDDMAAYGIPSDPPDVDEIDCEYMKRELHNALVDNGLFTWDDIQRSPVGLQVASTVVKKLLSGLFHEKAKQDKLRENSQIF